MLVLFFQRLGLAWMVMLGAIMGLVSMGAAAAEDLSDDVLKIHPSLVHLRSTSVREWSSFPERADRVTLECSFTAAKNVDDWMLSLRQQDVKETWEVALNEQRLGRLVRDENDLVTDLLIPAGALRGGDNTLVIRQSGRDAPDDIRVGQIEIRSLVPASYRNVATIQVTIQDDDHKPMPGRITIVNGEGALVPVGASSTDDLAVREGVIYTATGVAEFGVAAGDYKIFAGRGFEYGIGSTRVQIESGERAKRTFNLVREVDTDGWVCCDTHVHTLTHSGHGDATIAERMVTLAGEGIEMPIATDHNKHIDYDSIAKMLGVRRYFTPVIGNEVTTKTGHFNIFPVQAGAKTPDHEQIDWRLLLEDIFSVPNVRVAILNHGRDIHSDFRPLSPRHHVSLSGENLDDRVFDANAMELINSGAVQTDPMQLFGDWCGMINRGLSITPVGSSDSHDVARYIVGQGRTYIHVDDSDVANIDVDAATTAFVQGRVLVSYGLLATVLVNDSGQPGDLVTLPEELDTITVTAKVLGPKWSRPTSVSLYLNGRPEFSADLSPKSDPIDRGDPTDRGIRAEVQWQIPRSLLKNDSWISLVAKGHGIKSPHWPTAKPYQPDSIDFTPTTFASTGAVRIDVDGDHEFTSAYQYAQKIVAECERDLEKIVDRLDAFDRSVAIQAASILLEDESIDEALANASQDAGEPVRAAIAEYRRARRQSMIARLEQIE